jgi:hypothetical protein
LSKFQRLCTQIAHHWLGRNGWQLETQVSQR